MGFACFRSKQGYFLKYLVFVMEQQCFLWSVKYRWLTGCALDQTVWYLVFQLAPPSIPGQSLWHYGWQTCTVTRFCQGTSVFLCQLTFHQCCVFLLILILLLSEEQAGEAWQTSNKTMPCIIWEIIELESTFVFYVL